MLVTLGTINQGALAPTGPVDMKSYRTKVSKLTAHRPDPCTVAMNLRSSGASVINNDNNNGSKSQSVESLPFSVQQNNHRGGGQGKLTVGTYQGHPSTSSEVSGATILRMKGNKSSLPSALAKSQQYNRYSASGIPMRHSMCPDESSKILNLTKGGTHSS